jgi:hypothetical protein
MKKLKENTFKNYMDKVVDAKRKYLIEVIEYKKNLLISKKIGLSKHGTRK